MNRNILYSILFVGVIILQTFILDRLTFGVSIAPLAYIAFVALLPMQTSQLWMVLLSFALGVAVDLTGMAGLNTCATLFIGYFRYYLLRIVMGRDIMELGGVPSGEYVGLLRMVQYVVVIVVVHSFLVFSLESLTLSSLNYQLQRYGISCVISIIFMGLIMELFCSIANHRRV